MIDFGFIGLYIDRRQKTDSIFYLLDITCVILCDQFWRILHILLKILYFLYAAWKILYIYVCIYVYIFEYTYICMCVYVKFTHRNISYEVSIYILEDISEFENGVLKLPIIIATEVIWYLTYFKCLFYETRCNNIWCIKFIIVMFSWLTVPLINMQCPFFLSSKQLGFEF